MKYYVNINKYGVGYLLTLVRLIFEGTLSSSVDKRKT